MPSDKEVITLIEDYLRNSYSNRDLFGARELAKLFSEKKHLFSYVKLASLWIEKAKDWGDLYKRLQQIPSPLVEANKLDKIRLPLADSTGIKTYFIKPIAKTVLRFLKEFDMPKGENKKLFEGILGYYIFINPNKKGYVETIAKKGLIFKKQVVIKVPKEVPKTKKEIMLELEVKIASS